ncbi:growth/differentiation factor 10 [Rhynchocyon petersi]
MASGPPGTNSGCGLQLLLWLLLLLLLLQEAGGRHTASAGPAAAANSLSRHSDPQHSPAAAAAALGPGAQDMVAVHMFRLYDKYNQRGLQPGGGNTVRSFRARLEVVDQKALYFFNLTSMQDSEMILAATFHFYSKPQWPWTHEAPCKKSKNVSCRLLPPGPPARHHLLFHSLSQNMASQGLLRGAMALVSPPRSLWQAKDISPIIKAARQDGELLLSAQLDTREKELGMSRPNPHKPYILIYANDLAISEPNSVAVTLQRYDPFPARDTELYAPPNSSLDLRVRRAAQVSSSLQDNELPGLDEQLVPTHGVQHYHKHQLWPSPFGVLKSRQARKDRRKKASDLFMTSSQMLNFDEKTMKKARRKQWNEPRICSRRYLKVDFTDIGWNEWIISPKSFDAYYCAGACEFPMPKIIRPSNHATIQSIVRAVGIVPGIPEPCCVPDKMNSLGVLFLDENQNVVLKVYPNMSVETCACR